MFWNIFSKLCDTKGTTPTTVVLELNISRGSVTHWKNGKVPHHETLLKLADYFGVTVDYLLGKTDAKKSASDIKPNAVILDEKKIYMIPIYESVSAGFGTLAQNNIEDYTPLYFSSAAEAEETICVKVKGDSMFPKIEEGDIIQVRKQTSVDSGTIAVVLLDENEALVKKVLYGPDWIELHSINPMYPVMRFEKADVLRLRVLGKVNKIIKNV